MTNSFSRELNAFAWAMEPRALQSLIGRIGAVSDDKIESIARALAEKGDLLQMLALSNGTVAPNLERSVDTIGCLDVRDGVAHIAINGPMMKQVPCMFDLLGVRATSTEAVREKLAIAVESDEVESIQLDIDSPGGTVDGTAALADDVYAARGLKKITAHVSDIAASAALWVGSQADRIVAGPSAAVGSIGVYTVVDDTSEQNEKLGIKTHVVSSHELKGAFANGAPVTDPQLDDLRRNIGSYTSLFIGAVARGRGMSEEEVAELATGQVWIGKELLATGLVDDVKTATNSRGSTTAAFAALTETEDMNEHKEELERLRAANQALEETNRKMAEDKAKADAYASVLEAQGRVALIESYRDRIPAASLASIEKVVGNMGSIDEAKAFLEGLPVSTRSIRQSVAAQAIEGVVATRTVDPGIKSLAKTMGQSVDRVLEMQAVADTVDHVEHEATTDANGETVMMPVAVLKDGRRVTKTQLRAELGIKGALYGVLFLVASLFAGNAQAAALSAARATECKGGSTRACLMTASKTVYAGGMVMVVDAGTCEAAAASASNNGVAGISQETKTSAASGSYWLKYTEGAVCKMAGTTLGQDDVGVIVYAETDQEVDETAGANEPVAGVLYQYISASVGWVHFNAAISHGRMATTADPLTMTDDLTLGGGVGALTLTDSASSIVIPDNDATALDIGAAGVTSMIRFTTSTGVENVKFGNGIMGTPVAVTGVVTLDAADCGQWLFVTDAADGDQITLPATVAGCEYKFMFTGSDVGALIDITPAAADAIHGECTLAASVVKFSGVDDADVGLTKLSSTTGNTLSIVGDGVDGWYVTSCTGIWANN